MSAPQYTQNSPAKTGARALNALMEAPEFMKSIATRFGGDDVHAKKFVSMFRTAINKNDALLRCTPESIRIAAGQLAELDLSPVTAYGQAYLIPYKDQCQLQIGWRGLTHIAQRDGGVRYIHSEIVYKGDTFICSQGLEPKLVHDLNFDCQRDEKNMYAVYAVAILSDGTKIFEVMSKAQVDEIRDTYSQTVKNGRPSPWSTIAYGEMARKTVIKRLAKYLPTAEKLADAIDVDNRASFEEKDITAQSEIVEDLKDRVAKRVSAARAKPIVDVSEMEEAEYSSNEPEEESAPTVDKSALRFDTGDYQVDVLKAVEAAVNEGVMANKAIIAYCNDRKVSAPQHLSKEDAIVLITDIRNKFKSLYGE